MSNQGSTMCDRDEHEPGLRARVALALFGLFALLAGSGCSTVVGVPLEIDTPGMPPLAKTVTPTVYLTPHSQRFRIAVLNFRDQTAKADLVTESIADILTTELYSTNRFNLYDRGDSKHKVVGTKITSQDSPDDEAASEDKVETKVYEQEETLKEQFERLGWAVDGILVGYVTAFSLDAKGVGVLDVDFRIVNPHTGLVVFSDSGEVKFQSDLKQGSVSLDREDVGVLAQRIAASFVDLTELETKNIEVTDVTQDQAGAKITLNVGSLENNIKQGFAGFVVEKDPRTRVDHYLARFVIVNVFRDASVGVIIPHCINQRTCEESISPQEQVQGISIGADVRFK